MKTSDFDEMVELGRPFYSHVEKVRQEDRIGADISFHILGSIAVNQVCLPSLRLEHNPRQTPEYDHDYLLFEMYDHGDTIGMVGEHQTAVREGRLHLIDMSRTYRCLISGQMMRGVGVVIPHDLVDYDPSRNEAYYSCSRKSQRGRLLEIALQGIIQNLNDPTRHKEAETFGQAFVALVRTLVLRQADIGSELTQVGRDVLIKAFIERHLKDPQFGPESVLRNFGVSRATLYRMFQDKGGLANFIAQRRLSNVFADLMATDRRRGVVTSIAEKWGFRDSGTFHRRFRERFGVTPSELLMEHDKAVPGAPKVWHPIHDWLRKQ